MRKSFRYALRFLAIAATVTVVSLALLHHSSNPGPYADPPPQCPDVACTPTGCWSDGTVPHQGTKVKKLSRTPGECGNNLGGCETLPC